MEYKFDDSSVFTERYLFRRLTGGCEKAKVPGVIDGIRQTLVVLLVVVPRAAAGRCRI